ncbi:MAG: DUF5680 domain-containing protein [Anaerolineales bacterium]
MRQIPNEEEFVAFLVKAKQFTYASGGSASDTSVDPLLPGSHQLEFNDPPFFYRDIYFGESFFAGQEVVYLEVAPFWSMCYAGGMIGEGEDIEGVPGFLRAALKRVELSAPYRGPGSFEAQDLKYSNVCLGGVGRFRGREEICRQENLVYELEYIGGYLIES